MKMCFQEQPPMQEKCFFPFTEHVRSDEMKQETLAEQMDAGRLACDTQWNYVDGWQWQGNGDRSACQTIDCYPLAQLNTTLHLYDKQLNCNPSTCLLLSFHPLSFSGAIALSVIALSLCLYPFHTLSLMQLSLSLSLRATIPSLCFEQQSDGEGGTICKTCHLIGFL